MTEIYDRGVEQILWLQQFSPTLDLPFTVLTTLGDEIFFLVLLPFVYWCIDRRTGARLAVLYLISVAANSLLKLLVNEPRPFRYDPRVRVLHELETGGFPSGHTQSTVVIWLYLAHRYRQVWLWVLAAALLILVPLSRLYLGLHFPTDLVGGYVVGLLILWLFWRWQDTGERWLASLPLLGQLLLAFAPALLIVLVIPGWDEDAIAGAGALLGLGAGFAFERRYVGFETAGNWRVRGLRFVVAALVLGAIYLGLRILFAELEPAPFWRFVRYTLIGGWAAFGAPWLFVRTGLAAAPTARLAQPELGREQLELHE
jgi:membrane-associated phospholipid phosphatase